MIYIVAGTSRAGKTLVSRSICKAINVPYLSIDWLVMGFGDGMPDIGIHHMLMPDVIARKIWSFLSALCEGILLNGESVLIDGEAVLQELIVKLKNKYPDKIKICFLGYTQTTLEEKLEQIKKHALTHKDWISDKSDEYIIDHINNMLPHSIYIKKSCTEYGLKYFDTSKDFNVRLEDVKTYMIE